MTIKFSTGLFIYTFSIFLNFCASVPAQLPRKTNYNEGEARQLLNLAAGAYSLDPQACLNRTFPEAHLYRIFSNTYTVCDQIESSCAFYVVVSDLAKQIIIVFRGTKTKEQLLLEAYESIQPGTDFYGIGKVNKYFFRALNTLWSQVESVLNEPKYKSYMVTFTGHSLGGALASLSAIRTALEGLRTSNMIKLYTFGQPRVGNVDLAQKHDQLVPLSFRVVHRLDIIPHSPPCDKDDYAPGINANSDSKPCDPNNKERGFHHGTEIWYPNGMKPNDTYYECIGQPFGEDFFCSDSLTFELSKYKTYVWDHRHYFNHKVPSYGKLGCDPNHPFEETLDNDAVGPPINIGQLGAQSPQQNKPDLWLQARARVAGITRLLGLSNK